DGIRDFHVTGETCALPISEYSSKVPLSKSIPAVCRVISLSAVTSAFLKENSRSISGMRCITLILPVRIDCPPPNDTMVACTVERSEERRVGKECRCGWEPQ